MSFPLIGNPISKEKEQSPPVVLLHSEKTPSSFSGTIIDLETIGSFSRFSDSRAYQSILPVIFGCINNTELSIFCARNKDSITHLNNKTRETLKNLEKPFYAFNCNFEMGVLYHNLNEKVKFERELNKEKYEAKRTAVSSLNIPQYDDPFFDNGKLCMDAWLNGQTKEAMAHNRSCLLKERDILLKRGFREPDSLKFITD